MNTRPELATPVIVLATPHGRNDNLELQLRERLPAFRVVRIRARSELSFALLASLRPRFVFFPHWSWHIEDEITSNFTCVVFHMTDLPYGRGGSPLQNLIVRGHRETTISALRCEQTVDGGPIYMKRQLSLLGSAEEILQRASVIIGEMILELIQQEPVPKPQVGLSEVFTRRRPEDGNLVHARDLENAYDFIRMLDADGYPHAFLETDQLLIEFRDAVFTGESIDARVRISKRKR